MNKVFLVGNLTRDPEISTTTSGISVCRMSIAVGRRFPNAEGGRDADFFNVTVWRKQAENVKNYLSKGSQVAIEGRLQSNTYDDANGQKRTSIDVVADNVEFIGSRNSSNNSNNMNSSASNAGPTPYDFGDAPEPKGTDVDSNPFADFGNSIEISDDELPF